MNFALDLFLTTLGMIYFLVILAEVIFRVQGRTRGDK